MDHALLLVDDDSLLLESTKTALLNRGYEVQTAKSGEEAIEKVKAQPHHFSLVILDHGLPGKNGAETAQNLIAINSDIYILMYSTSAKIPFKTGNVEFIDKGSEPELFFEAVASWCHKFDETTRTVEKSNSPSENERLISSIGLIGRSAGLAEIAKRILKYESEEIAPTALLRGETGTGKERIARALHTHSARKHRAFIAINCGAIAETLIESELFGHAKGAFTGAVQNKIGKFKLADGGTLFLDEIGDTSPAFQVKLLRVLQEREFTPVGSNEVIKTNVRIIAATHKDLEKEIAANRFREDLYYRLKTVTFTVPPLRERPEDIEPFVAYVCERYNAINGTNKSLLLRTVRFLERAAWRGNIRELEATIESFLADSSEDKIGPEVIGSNFFRGPTSLELAYKELRRRQDEEEREFFTKLLRSAASQRDASVKIGVPTSTIVSTLKRLGLPTTFSEDTQANTRRRS